ncbi:MAG TPA: excinuclease ABC subunit UvrA, partial [Aggregatilineales bacterium]|nr:excinuclease ABC subunit UvrA [Aggregatilineales bacterium]
HCPVCGEEVKAQSAQQIVEDVQKMADGTRIQILAPVIKNKKGNHQKVLDELRQSGFTRIRADGEVRELADNIALDRYVIHNLEVVVDRLVIRHPEDPNSDEAKSATTRLTDSIETSLKLGEGIVVINDITTETAHDTLYSELLACVNGHGSIPEIEPSSFSFNTPRGACPECQGLGFKLEFDPASIIPNPELSIIGGAIQANGWNFDDDGWGSNVMKGICAYFNIAMDAPWSSLSAEQQKILLHGTGGKKVPISYVNRYGQERTYQANFEGVITNLSRRYRETSSDEMRESLQQYMTQTPCAVCKGYRLRPEALAVTIAEKRIHEVTALPVSELVGWVSGLRGDEGHVPLLNQKSLQIGHQILKEIAERVRFLNDVGLGYLSLGRSAGTLSGGEAQRIRLATQIGSRLTGVLYVLDEP